MDNPSSTQPSGPEKPAAAQFSTPAQPSNGQLPQGHLQPLGLPKAEPFKTSKPFALAKFVLGSFNLVFAVIALGLTLGVITTSFRLSSFISVIICLSLAVASIIWQLAEHITLAVRRNWRSIHPGAHVGVHLVLWVLAILVVPTLYISLAYELRDYTVEPDCEIDDSGIYYSSYNSYNNYCSYLSFRSQGAADTYFRIMEALAAFATLLLISHFTLFVLACVETDRRRRYGKANKVVYLVAAPGPVDGRMYYTPVGTQALGYDNRGSVLAPQPVHRQHQQQANADPGIHGYYAPPAGAQPGTAV